MIDGCGQWGEFAVYCDGGEVAEFAGLLHAFGRLPINLLKEMFFTAAPPA